MGYESRKKAEVLSALEIKQKINKRQLEGFVSIIPKWKMESKKSCRHSFTCSKPAMEKCVNLFKVSLKDSKLTFMMSFWYLHRYGVSSAHFEKVNAVWCELFESVCVYIYICCQFVNAYQWSCNASKAATFSIF